MMRRMSRSFSAVRTIGVALLASLVGIGVAWGADVLGAGGASHAWVVLQDDPEPTPDGEEAEPITWLYHLPGDAEEPGGALRVKRLRLKPEALAASGARLLLVFPSESGGQEGGSEAQEGGAEGSGEVRGQRLVRTVSVAPRAARGLYTYTPSDRLAALPSLPGDPALIDVVATRLGGVALLEQNEGDTPKVLALSDLEWREAPLPEDWPEGASARLTLDREQAALLAIPTDPGAEARLWRLEKERGESPAWSDPEPAPRPAEGERLVGAPTAIVGASRTAEGDVALRLLRSARWMELATIEDVPEAFSAMALGDDVALAWMGDEEEVERLHVAFVSISSGSVIYRGPARSASPVSVEDLRVLALLLAAIMATVIIFVLKPAAANAEVRLPSDVVMAGFLMRLVAACLDLAPGIFIASALYDAPVAEILATPIGGGAAIGLTPFLTALGIMLLHSAASEALTGRTIGKWAMRLRTVSIDGGGRPSLWQAFARNLVKVIAPPVIILVALDPNRRHPGDLVTGTAVVSPSPSAPSEE
jgi:uncharacterized RDD family membrane protein YckC